MKTRALTIEQQAARLEAVARALRARGDHELAAELNPVVMAIRDQIPGELLTTGEAASLLGVRSVNTIKRWVREGLLDGFRRGGRVLVSKDSILRLTASPTLAAQQARDR